jgi:putative GTP pyrophosphokinase
MEIQLWRAMLMPYELAVKELTIKFQHIIKEYKRNNAHSPIEQVSGRVKSVSSILEKLQRKNMEVSINSAVENLYDIAGVRVVCSYIQDVFQIADLLSSQDDISVKRVNDYIHHPKPNGYRSLHLVIEVPVFLAEGRMMVPVEVQIRTIAMDFWASLEHNLRYKADGIVPQDIADELLRTAQDIAAIDERMQTIHDRMSQLDLKAPRQLSLFDDQ